MRLSTSPQSEDKFARVVLPHLADAVTLARWIAGNRSDAEDIVQEASLRAYRSIDTFRGENARAWFLMIVRNSAYSWLTKHRDSVLVSFEELDSESRAEAELGGALFNAEPESPERSLITQAERSDLEQAISSLPMPFREVVVLRDIQGLSYHEIAAVAGIAIGTVMSRLARGRRRLIHTLRKGA